MGILYCFCIPAVDKHVYFPWKSEHSVILSGVEKVFQNFPDIQNLFIQPVSTAAELSQHSSAGVEM
jgi:hypothetical protein